MARKSHKHDGTHRVPSRIGHESNGAAARVGTKYNVLDLEFTGIQQRIEETKRGLAVGNTVVVEQRDYARHCLVSGGQLCA